jgi:hypothetical protein
MKKVLLVAVSMLLAGVLNAGDGQSRIPYGSYENNYTPTDTAISVSSSAVTKSDAISYGIVRKYQNLGTGDVYYNWSVSTTTGTVVTYGIRLSTGTTYTEDVYFGDIYFASDTATNDVRVKSLRQK